MLCLLHKPDVSCPLLLLLYNPSSLSVPGFIWLVVSGAKLEQMLRKPPLQLYALSSADASSTSAPAVLLYNPSSLPVPDFIWLVVSGAQLEQMLTKQHPLQLHAVGFDPTSAPAALLRQNDVVPSVHVAHPA